MYTRNKMLENQWRDTARMHRKLTLSTRNELVVHSFIKVSEAITKGQIGIPTSFEEFWHPTFAPLRSQERQIVRAKLAETFPAK